MSKQQKARQTPLIQKRQLSFLQMQALAKHIFWSTAFFVSYCGAMNLIKFYA
jgi:REP element-mobilizing transposase RayT